MMRFRHSLQSVLLGATFLVAPSVLLAQEASLTSATPTSSKSDQTSQQSEASTVLEWITVEGAQRVERETVLAYMVIREGMVATPKLINQSIKTLFGSGLFADVSVRRDGKGIVVSVVENPIINRISFEGNSKINDDTLGKESNLRPRLVYTRSKVQDDVERFLELYRRAGRFGARIEPKVVQLPQNRVDLVFEIVEGPVTGIQSIKFIGNEAYDDGRLLDEIMTSQTRWWKFLSSSDNYDPDRIAYDRELMRQFYLARGYADFRVISSTAELTREGDAFFVTFNMEEGALYDFGDADVETSLTELGALDLTSLIKHGPGDKYDSRKIDATVDILTKVVGEKGFAFAEIRPRVRRDSENQIVNVTYLIEEGPRVYVERINITGNSRTQDEVIRREMRLSEGDGFNRVLLSRSERDVKGLGYFAEADIVEQPGSEPDKTIIDVNVEEQSTGELTLGVGYSTTDDFSTQFSVTERNLGGRGQKLQLSVSASSEVQQYKIGFTEPYFLGRDLSAGGKIFNTTIEYDNSGDLKRTETGFGLNIGFPTSEDGRISFFTNFQQDKLEVGTGDSIYSSRYRPYDVFKVEVGYFYYIDKRDDIIDTTEGWNLGFGQDLAGPSGDVTYVRTTVNADYYYPIADGIVFHAGLDGGMIADYDKGYVLYNDRFFRGASSFRGFDRSGVGPRNTAGDYSLGANKYIIGTLETSLPLGIPKELGMKTKAFIDFGAVGDTDEVPSANIEDDFAFRASAGISISWKSPIGPIQFDFASALAKEDYDKDKFFRFSAGTRF